MASPSSDGREPPTAPADSRRAYLDHASASPIRPAAAAAAVAWLGAADPGRMHAEGLAARVALEDGRRAVATGFGTRPRQVIFTAGATEAINAATYGAVVRHRARTPAGGSPVIALAGVEHAAVRQASEQWAGEAHLRWIPVDRAGRLDVDALRAVVATTPDLALVHCQWVNHEVGTIQPVAEVVEACRAGDILVHVDAAAAAGHIPIDFDTVGADLLSLSAPKLGGPRGAGAMLVRRGLRVPPLLVGGDQERARRAGLEDVGAAVGLAAAVAELSGTLATEGHRAVAHTDRLRSLARSLPGVTVFGPTAAGERAAHMVCLGLDGVEAETVLLGLDQAGVAAHSGSACSSEALEPSPVLAAMGVEAERSLRLSVGWSTTDADIDRVATALPAILDRLRGLSH